MKCTCCGTECDELHRHHIVPRALGGTDYSGNIVTICTTCHSLIHQTSFVNHSALTRAGLKRARERGVKLGGYRPGHRSHHEAITRGADEFALLVGPEIAKLRTSGMTYAQIATQLTELEVPTRQGGDWHGTTVRNVFIRYQHLTSTQTVTPN